MGEALWAIDVQGGRKRRITFTPRCMDTGPAWSPDGKRIAFASDRAPAPPGNTDIYVMDANGRHYRDVTPDRQADSDPAWSPDGTKIAYLREPLGGGEAANSGTIEAIPCGAVRAKIEVVDVKSGRAQVVGRVGSCGGERPSWSRDGKQLLVWTGNESLVLMNADGNGSRRLLRRGFYPDAVFSPDGKHIAATCSPRDSLELDTDVCLMRTDGKGLRILTSSSSITSNFDPAWSPDSRRIIFARCDKGARQGIWVMDADGRAQHRLSRGRPLFAGCGDDLDSAPSWRPGR